MKNGLFYENNELIYYKNGKPNHAGVIKVDGDIYYISSKGNAVRGEKTVHRDKANGLLERGFYTFGEDYKLVEGSFRPVKKQRGYRIRNFRHKLKKNKKLNKFFRKKNILPVLAVAGSICLLTFLVQTAAQHRPVEETVTGQESTVISDNREITLPAFEEEVLLNSEKAKQLYDHQITIDQALTGGDPYQPMCFTYRLDGQAGTLLISEDEVFSDPWEFTLIKDSETVIIDNLKTGMTYVYRLLVGEEVYEGSFKTAESTRFVSIPGVKNTRDIGGYTTTDGRTVRQGLVIRGQEIDGLVEKNYFIPKDAVGDVQETFGFAYDFDLREASLFKNGSYTSRLGKDVGHRFYDSPMYGEIFRETDRIGEVFRDLARPEHYPMYLHCTYGADRTGTIVFLLQGLLGMSEEDMICEYRRTAFALPGQAEQENIDIIIDGMNAFAGETLQEKIESYFIESVGLTAAEITSIRSIFLE